MRKRADKPIQHIVASIEQLVYAAYNKGYKNGEENAKTHIRIEDKIISDAEIQTVQEEAYRRGYEDGRKEIAHDNHD